MNQKKAKFNIVDVLVLLVLVAGVAFVGLRMFGGTGEPAAEIPNAAAYRVTFAAEAVPQAVADSLTLGAKAENGSGNMDLGTVVDVSVGEAVVYNVDSAGQTVVSTKPGWASVELTCELTGIQQPTGVMVGTYSLNVGHSMTVLAGNTELEVTVMKIQPVSGK